jgi:serine/threonine protein kinase
VIHRDLAARNILLRSNNDPVISDFGFARVAVDDGGQTQASLGPLRWMPPESLKNKLYSIKSDVWSFGVTVYLFDLEVLHCWGFYWRFYRTIVAGSLKSLLQ